MKIRTGSLALRRWVTGATMLWLLAGCAQKGGAPQAQVAPLPPLLPPTKAQLQNASVAGIFDAPVVLRDGRYEGPPAQAGAASRPTLLLWAPSIEFGNIDGVEGNEAVALLSSSTGGSGEFVHLAVFGVDGSAARSMATAPVGDRVQLIRMWLEPGKVLMDVIEAGPREAACCPTQVARKVFEWQPGGELQLLASDAISVLSVNLLAATDWMLVAMDGEPVPRDVMPPTALIQYGKIAGFAGCNRYAGPLTETEPGSLEVGILTATKKACPGTAAAIEQQFLARLARMNRYKLQAGELLLSGPAGNGAQSTLLFAR
jgi:heat shock protein HslJ